MFLESNLMDIEKTLAVCVYLRNKHQVKVFESLELNLVVTWSNPMKPKGFSEDLMRAMIIVTSW